MSAEQEEKQNVAEQGKDEEEEMEEKQNVAEQGKDEEEEMEEGDLRYEEKDDVDMKCQLYVRFAIIVPPEDELKTLHPDIIRVDMKKQEQPKWCYLSFPTPEKAKQAKIELTNKPYKNQGHLMVEFRSGRGHCMDPKQWLVACGFPDETTNEEVMEELLRFGCSHCHLYKEDRKKFKKGSAKLIFNTGRDAEAFLNNKELHTFKGHSLTVEHLRTRLESQLEKRQKKIQRRKEKKKLFKNWARRNRNNMAYTNQDYARF